MTIIAERLKELPNITLDQGPHKTFEDGHCAMEVISYLAGLGFTDAPKCASPVLRTYTISINDQWDDTDRQRLTPYLPRMIGTNADGKDEARSYLALDWLIRTYTPAWLDLAGLTTEARELRDLRRIVGMVSAGAAGPVVQNARKKTESARVASWDAAWDAARDAARDAAWDAARAAAWDSAEVAARDSVWVAAGDAAGVAAGVSARAAARVAAWDAAWDAAEVAARDSARAAAWNAARAALKPTVTSLQTSALDLLDSMIDPAS